MLAVSGTVAARRVGMYGFWTFLRGGAYVHGPKDWTEARWIASDR